MRQREYTKVARVAAAENHGAVRRPECYEIYVVMGRVVHLENHRLLMVSFFGKWGT